jgi:hypothetical protein
MRSGTMTNWARRVGDIAGEDTSLKGALDKGTNKAPELQVNKLAGDLRGTIGVSDNERQLATEMGVEVVDSDTQEVVLVETLSEGGSVWLGDHASNVETAYLTSILICLTFGVVEVGGNSDDRGVTLVKTISEGGDVWLDDHVSNVETRHLTSVLTCLTWGVVEVGKNCDEGMDNKVVDRYDR